MGGRRIVIEYEVDLYSVCREIPAIPDPIKLNREECFSEEEALQVVKKFIRRMPRLLNLPEEVKKGIKESMEESRKLVAEIKKDNQKEEGFRKTMLVSIEGRP